jgi:hypothetical protein
MRKCFPKNRLFRVSRSSTRRPPGHEYQEHRCSFSQRRTQRKPFLDDILVKPTSLLRNMNIVEWTHLITAAITLARLARLEPEQARAAGIEHLQIKVQVDTYILTLCKRMFDLGVSNVQYDASGLFSWFKAIAQGIRLWVSGPGGSGEHDHVDAESSAKPATSETLQDLTLQNGSNQQGEWHKSDARS